MGNHGLKAWLVFLGSLLVSFVLVWFGLKLLAFDGDASSSVFYVLGFSSVLAGIFCLSSTSKGQVIACVSLIIIGLYFFARANEIIEARWLSRLAGLASLVAASFVVYLTIPRSSKDQPQD